MNVLVLGGDLRYLEVIENLSVRNNVDVVGYRNTYINDRVNCINIDDVCISKYDSIIFPVNGVMDNNLINCRFNNTSIKLNDDFLVGCKNNCLIFSGIPTSNLNKLLDNASMDCVYLMKDKEVVNSNSIPTVEGIIADIVLNTEITVNESNILVFGYGNIGKVLVKYLKMLGANVTVSIIEPADKKVLDNMGIDCFYSSDTNSLVKEIGSNDIIINTVPNTVIDNSLIKYINRDSYILDIASHPHGVDREVLDEFFIKNKLYLGIPGKVAPKTSGKILSKKINQVMGD
jgi:dipicolinate synthase subunit A